MKLEGWHLVIVILLAVMLFGAPKLPGLARSVGQSLRIFRSEVRQMKEENPSASTAGDAAGPVAAAPAVPEPAMPANGTAAVPPSSYPVPAEAQR